MGLLRSAGVSRGLLGSAGGFRSLLVSGEVCRGLQGPVEF